MSTRMHTVNLKQGLPTVEEARRRLAAELARARAANTSVIKIIHGYGSTGQGGSLRQALRRSLAHRRKEGAIREFLPGERFSMFDPLAAELIRDHPELQHDSDRERDNEGITLVFL